MFETLLASQIPALAWRRPALIAFLVHGGVIAAAAAMTGTRGVADPGERDTIRLELQFKQFPSRPSPPAPELPGPPSVPPIDLSSRPQIRLDPPLAGLPSVPQILGDRSIRPEAGIPSGGEAQPSDSTFSSGEVDRLPELTGEVRALYPSALQGSGLSGVVELEYVISAEGRVDRTTVRILGSAHPEFSRSAINALLQARFRPALRAGRPVPVRVGQKIRFIVR